MEASIRLFIVGMPRSGTSWLGKIFDGHPRVLYRFEPDTIDREGAPPYLCPSDAVSQYLDATRAYLDRMALVRTSKSVGNLPYLPKSYRSAPLERTRLAMTFSLKAAERLNLWPSLSRRVAIPDLIDRGRPEALVIKSIESTGRINVYRAAWPDSRVIFIVRHPCGQIASTIDGIRRRKFADHTPSFDDQGMIRILADTEQARRRGLTQDHLMRMKPIERLAWMWALPNEKAMEDIADDANAQIIRYRDLCAAPNRVTQDLFQFAGISWNPQVETFIRDSTDPEHARSDKYYSVFRDPRLSVDRWRSVLSAQDVTTIRYAVADTLPGRLFENW